MKILHFVSTGHIKTYPLGTPGRFTDLLEALKNDGHENIVLLPEIPVLQAALERKEIPFTLTNISFIDNLFRVHFYKKILKTSKPDIVLRYHNDDNDDLDILEDSYDGPIRNIMDFYFPILAPDASIKKMDREETLTDPADFVIGCFAPDQNSIDNIDILFQSLPHDVRTTLWFSIDPELSPRIQKMAADYGMEDKSRFFDVTVPRGAFYKGCDLIFVPKGEVASDMSFVEALSLGRPVISCTASHQDFAKGDNLNILKNCNRQQLAAEIRALSEDAAYRIKLGETGRQVYENSLTPSSGLKQLLSHI